MFLNQNPIIEREPISRLYDVGRSLAATIAKNYVRQFHLSSQTYVRQKAVQGGLLLEFLELHAATPNENTNFDKKNEKDVE
jgi:hypothetical protein